MTKITTREILNTTEHRPWNVPEENWSFYQEWSDAIFLHYKVDINELKKFVPEALEIDLFDGSPWVSVVAFTMKKIRPKYVPAFSPISNFHEINVRTYVKSNNKCGVYFLSIEAGSSLSCKIAKGISELPYRYSKIKRTDNTYISQNSTYHDTLNLHYNIGKEQKEKTELDIWLTERYALFQDTENFINAFEIHHLEWPINNIELRYINVNYPRFKNLVHNKPNTTHYSKGVQVISWGKKKMEK